jgi:hypothetical protein
VLPRLYRYRGDVARGSEESEVMTDRSCLLHPHTAKPSYRSTVNGKHRQRWNPSQRLYLTSLGSSSLKNLIRHAWCHIQSTRAAHRPFDLVSYDCEKPSRSQWIPTYIWCVSTDGDLHHAHTATTGHNTTRMYRRNSQDNGESTAECPCSLPCAGPSFCLGSRRLFS